MLSTTVTPEPSASQDRAGCRRRGEWSKITAMVTTSVSRPNGQRPHCHQVLVRSDQPYSATIASPKAPPATRTRNPRPTGTARTAVITAARKYLYLAGRSRRIP